MRQALHRRRGDNKAGHAGQPYAGAYSLDRTFGSLTLERSAMYVWNGATVTVTGAFKSENSPCL